MNTEKITALRPGERFTFKGFDWICLDPHHPDGGVLIIMAEPWRNNLKFCPDEQYADEKGNWNNYRTSLLRKEVLGLVKVIGADNLRPHELDLVADNGDKAYNAYTVMDDVFVLSCDEYRKYREFIPHYNSWIWTATPWYCGDKDSDTGHAYYVRYVNTEGRLYNYYACDSCAVAPACILNPASLNLRRQAQVVEV